MVEIHHGDAWAAFCSPEGAGESPMPAQPTSVLYQALLDGMSDLAWIKDADSRFIAVNRALADLFHTTRQEMIGRTDFDYVPADLAEAYMADDRSVLRNGQSIRRVERIVGPSGEERWLETLKSIIVEHGEAVGTLGIGRDVTAQQRAEFDRQRLLAEIEHQHARLAEMLGNVPGVVWEEPFDGSPRYVSDYVQTMLGYSAEEYLARFQSVLELVHEDDREMFRLVSRQQIDGTRSGTHRFRLVRKDGRVIWCESHASVIRNERGEAIGMRGVSMDVTEQIAADQALRRSEARFRQFAEVAPVMIWTTNAIAEAEYQNRAVAEFTGDPDLVGEKWLECVHPEDRERVVEAMRGAHERAVWTPFEMRFRRHDGDYRDIYVAAVPQFDADGAFAGFVGTSIDLTDDRRLARRLEEDQRLESLGHLAASIAHEINNVLMSIQPFSEVLHRSPDPATLTRVAERIDDAVVRGGRITHQILRHAHTSEPAFRPLDVKAWLETNADELQTMLGNGVELRLDIADDLRMAADPHHLHQVFTNLAANASDAMNGHGTFTISAREAQSWDGLPACDDGYVHFIVEDDGPGIPSDLGMRIFEPLFTTKSHGTGLGLAIVFDILRKHGGTVRLDHDSDHQGARFHIVVPATRAVPAAKETSDTWPEQIRTVLLVEDEKRVAEALTLLVELQGAEAAVVHRGAEAMRAIELFAPDLVVLDVGLPDLSGMDVFKLIRDAHPTLPVLFASGHAGQLEGQIASLQGPVGYILKPFDIAKFLAAVRKVV